MCRIGDIKGEAVGSMGALITCSRRWFPLEDCQPVMRVDGFSSADETVAVRFTMRNGTTGILGGVKFEGHFKKGRRSNTVWNLEVVLSDKGLGNFEDLVKIDIVEDSPEFKSYASL